MSEPHADTRALTDAADVDQYEQTINGEHDDPFQTSVRIQQKKPAKRRLFEKIFAFLN